MSVKLRREFIELLEKDVEFRYIVAGYLGYSEILKRLDELDESLKKLWENQNRLWENQNKLWEEIKALREEQVKLWENQNRLWESQKRLWEEVKALREGQNKLWENQNRLWEEVKALREGQNKLWENQNKLWKEVKALRENQVKLWENQNRLWEEVKALREGQNRLWEEVKALREGQDRLWREVRWLRVGLRELGRAVGRSLEDYTIGFVELLLEDLGYPVEKIRVGRKVLVYDNEAVEINVFNEDPLLVGEVTTYIGSREDAEREFGKLLRRVEIVEKIYGRRVEMKLLAVGNISADILDMLTKMAEKHGIRLIHGRKIYRLQ